jgi:membrane associated rhomboid family serine protease
LSIFGVLNSLALDIELKNTLRAFVWPLIIVAAMWVVFLLQHLLPFSPALLAVHPLHLDGLHGIFTAVFVHKDAGHIFSNTIPLLVLGWALFYYYREFALKALILMWLTAGLWVWFFARENYHIGASGLVYALAAFHIVSALLRRVFGLMAFAMLVIFLYGGMVWGFFPELFPKENISWESHFMGALSGVVYAFYYRKTGIQKPVYDDDDFYDDDEEEDNNLSPYQSHIRYFYKENEKDRGEN